MTGWLKHSTNSALQRQRHLVFAAWLALLVQSLLEYPYAYAYFSLPMLLLAGTVEAKPQMAASAWAMPSRVAIAVTSIAVILLVAIVWDYAHLEEDYRQARFTRHNYQNQPHHDFYEAPLILDVLSTMNRAALRPLHPGMSADEIEEMRTVARRIQIPAIQVDYAKTLALNGKMSAAQDELAILHSLYSPEAYAAIESEWKTWLADNASRLPNP